MNLIKKIRLAVSLLAFALFLGISFAGCADEQALAEIDKLKAENEMLRSLADSLQQTLNAMNAHGDSVRKSLEGLDMGF